MYQIFANAYEKIKENEKAKREKTLNINFRTMYIHGNSTNLCLAQH